jgi:hypothetical protein
VLFVYLVVTMLQRRLSELQRQYEAQCDAAAVASSRVDELTKKSVRELE